MQQQTLLFTDETAGYFDQLDAVQQHALLTLMASLIVEVYSVASATQEESADE